MGINSKTMAEQKQQYTAPPAYGDYQPQTVQPVQAVPGKAVPVAPPPAPGAVPVAVPVAPPAAPRAVPVAAAPRAVPATVYYQPVDMVEVEEVSPVGWMCCILTCPFIFPFNFL